MSQNFNQPPLDNAPIPLFLEDPVPKKKTYEIDELINFLAETKQVCDDMAALGFKHKEYFEAAKVQREYADKYQAVIDALKAHKEEPGYIAAVRDIVDYMRRFDSDAETIEQQFS